MQHLPRSRSSLGRLRRRRASFFGPGHNDRDIDDHVFATYEFPGKTYAKDKNDIVVVTYSSISTNGFENYGECVMGDRGTLIVEKEESVMLYPENEPGKVKTQPRGTEVGVSPTATKEPVLESGSTWGGPSASVTGTSVGTALPSAAATGKRWRTSPIVFANGIPSRDMPRTNTANTNSG